MKELLKYKNFFIIFGSFFLGTVLSAGLLNYSGKELVNVLYFLFFVVVLPFFISLFSFLFRFSEKNSSLAGVFFSLGALSSLLVTIVTRDVAFGWATTLDVKPRDFHHFLSYFAFWKSFCSSCMPSLELVEVSRFNRLGSVVSPQQIKNAEFLGQWWKFLAMSLLVYGVLFRFLIYLLSLKTKSKLVQIVANKSEKEFKQIDSSYENISSFDSLSKREFKLLGYYVDVDSLNLSQNKSAKDIVIAVKSYEPPILDFFDYLDEVIEENPNSKISLLMIGLNGDALKKDVDIWKRKLKELDYDFVEVIS